MTTPATVVLLVEDEPLILIHSHLALEDAGYAIVVARDAEEAFDALATRPDIGALFTDVQLSGGIDGLALARHARARNADLAIVVTSGSVAVDPDTLPVDGRFLAKPYTAVQVTRALEAAAL